LFYVDSAEKPPLFGACGNMNGGGIFFLAWGTGFVLRSVRSVPGRDEELLARHTAFGEQ
jgi:hypothetical protein